MKGRTLAIIAGVAGATGIAMGAFGAHALPDLLQALPADELQRRADWLETGSRYHLVHATALLALALADAGQAGRFRTAAIAWLLGLVLFSGVLYLMAFTGVRGLGAIVPLGGVAYMVGWCAVAVSTAKG